MRKTARLIVGAIVLAAFVTPGVRAQAVPEKHVPTVADLMGLKSAGSARISPDGSRVAYTVTETDLAQDAYVTQIWLADVATGKTFQLTRGEKSCTDPTWSPDGLWLAFLSSRDEDKSQIFVIRPDGGEAVRLTKAGTGVGDFAWSPDGRTVAYTSADPVSDEAKARKDFYGDFTVVRREYTHTHLWTVDVAEALRSPGPGARRTAGREFTVGGFDWAPDGKTILFSTWEIWRMFRTPAGWTVPEKLGPAINSDRRQDTAYAAADGSLWYCCVYGDRKGIYRAPFADGTYGKPVRLEYGISSAYADCSPCIAPDESYLIFASARPGYGIWDLYVSFRNSDGSWTAPKNMGPAINTRAKEIYPFVSFDGKYLFFMSNRVSALNNNPIPDGPGNVYWVDARVIESLAPARKAQ